MIHPSINPLLAATVRCLDKAQPMSMSTIISKVPGLKPSMVTLGVRSYYIENVAEQGMPARYAATNEGRERYGIPVAGLIRAPGRLHFSTDTYDGAELRPFTGRPGSQDAAALKSAGYGC